MHAAWSSLHEDFSLSSSLLQASQLGSLHLGSLTLKYNDRIEPFKSTSQDLQESTSQVQKHRSFYYYIGATLLLIYIISP